MDAIARRFGASTPATATSSPAARCLHSAHRDGGLMDGRSGRTRSDDDAAQRLVLGLDPAMVTFRCADCGAVGEPGTAPMVKVFLMDQLLGCEATRLRPLPRWVAGPTSHDWLRQLGYGGGRGGGAHRGGSGARSPRRGAGFAPAGCRALRRLLPPAGSGLRGTTRTGGRPVMAGANVAGTRPRSSPDPRPLRPSGPSRGLERGTFGSPDWARITFSRPDREAGARGRYLSLDPPAGFIAELASRASATLPRCPTTAPSWTLP